LKDKYGEDVAKVKLENAESDSDSESGVLRAISLI
jgi:hypothetical protein